MKAYLISLHGQGDHELKLVTKETFNWLTDPAAALPASLKKRDDVEVPSWHGSSPDNDRALCAVPEIGEAFWSMKDMMAWVRKHKVEIVDTYEGMIY